MISMNFSVNTKVLPRGLAWYAKRLSVMGPGEIMHRVRNGLVIQSLQLRHRLSRVPSGVQYAEADLAAHEFCRGLSSCLPELPWEFRPSRETVDALLTGTLSVLGHRWIWRNDPSVWHEAPDTNRQWPRVFFHRIPYREGNPYGDIRIAWEPSRLQQLVALALYARAADESGRRRAVALIEQQFLSWIEANPPLTGIHYVSVMECALRLIAVCHAMDLIRPWIMRQEEIWAGVLNLVHEHAELIRKRISVHSSAGNHTIAEAAGLVYAGFLFPAMPMAEHWRVYGLYLLEQEATHQIRQDGGGREEGLWYLQFVSDLYGLVVMLLRHLNHTVPAKLELAFERSCNFLHEMMRPGDGYLPRIGDGDDGYALSPYLKFVSPPKEPEPGLISFHLSGYSILRGPNQERMIFDHGELGMPPCFAHGHADALAVTLDIGRQSVLVDPGTFTYMGHQTWRRYFRGTRAHNTVTVNGQDQAVQETAFLWSQPFETHLIYREQTPDGKITVLARHYGYVRRFGVTHWRGVVYQPPGAWLIWDWLTGSGTHHLELNWHLGGDITEREGRYLCLVDGEPLQLMVEGGRASVHRGQELPLLGWHAPHYGTKRAIPTVRVEHHGTLPHEFMTRIWRGAGEPPPLLQSFAITGARHGTSAC